eukprot:g2104.t1
MARRGHAVRSRLASRISWRRSRWSCALLEPPGMAKRPKTMTLFERFQEALEQRCSTASEDEAAASVLAKDFASRHADKIQALWRRFGCDGKLPEGEFLPASTYNDFYKWTMMPVIRALEQGTGEIQCTFSANIRDAKLNSALLESAKQDPPGDLFKTLRSGLEELAQRRFDDEETIQSICGTAEAPRTMVQELDLNPRGTRRLPSKPGDVLVQAFIGTDVKTGQERVFVEATGPWHRVTWLETSTLASPRHCVPRSRSIYESFFRRRMRERYGEEDALWYGKWLAEAFLRCARSGSEPVRSVDARWNGWTGTAGGTRLGGASAPWVAGRSVLAAKASNLRGVIMTGRRTGGLPLMLLQGMFIHSMLKDDKGAVNGMSHCPQFSLNRIRDPLSLGTSSVTAHYWLKDAGVEGELLPPAAGTHAHELSMVSSAIFGETDDKAGVPISQLISHMLYFLRSRPRGDVREAKRKAPVCADGQMFKLVFKLYQGLDFTHHLLCV